MPGSQVRRLDAHHRPPARHTTTSTLILTRRIDVTMYETLLRPHEVQQLPPPRPLSQVIDKLKGMERYREEKRQRQIANAGKRKRDAGEPTAGIRMGMGMGMGMEAGMEMEEHIGTEMEGTSEKRARVAAVQASIAPARGLAEGYDENLIEESRRETVLPFEDAATSAVAGPSQVDVPSKLNLAKVSPDVRGHTSYLTFARLVPLPLPEPSSQVQDPLVPA